LIAGFVLLFVVILLFAMIVVVKLLLRETFGGILHGLVKECLDFVKRERTTGAMNFAALLLFVAAAYLLIRGDLFHELSEVFRPLEPSNTTGAAIVAIAPLVSACFALYMLYLLIIFSIKIARLDRRTRRRP
jgi:hypothetical protein